MSEFLSTCPHCGTALVLQDEWIGSKVQCFQCKNKFLAVKPNDDAIKNKINGSTELNSTSAENEDLFNFVCPMCKTMEKLPVSLKGQIYECNACCEKSIAEPATERLCPICNGVIKFNATVCKHCKQIIPLNATSGKNSHQTSFTPNGSFVQNNPNNYYNNAPHNNKGTNVTVVQQFGGTPPQYTNSANNLSCNGQKSKSVYILLGVLLGHIGVHDFYAGYTTNGIIKLLISLVVGWLILPLIGVWIWAIIDVCTIDQDANGVPFC